MKIAELLPWGPAKEVNTKLGRRILRKAMPTESFSAAWRANKEALRSAGVSWSKRDDGSWEVCWWAPISQAQVEQERARVEASRATTADVVLPHPEGLDYLPYQKAGIQYILGNNNTLLGDQMGLGKTIQAIGVINADESIKRVLVVCPRNLRANWGRELSRWLTRPLKVGMAHAQSWPEGADVVVVHYDVLKKWTFFLGQEWDLLILDEAHYIKNGRAQRTKAVVGSKREGLAGIKARRKLPMTGTPITNRPIELWPIIHYLWPDRFPNMVRFAMRYCRAKQTRWGWDFSGASNLDELQTALRGAGMLRRLKSEVLTELPFKRRQVIEMPAEDSVMRDAVAAELSEWQNHEASIEAFRLKVELAKVGESDADYSAAVAELRQAEQVAFESMSRRRRETAVAKLPLVVEHVKNVLESNGKVTVFAHHRDVIAALAKELAEFNPVTVWGGLTDAETDAAVQRFQNDPACRVFLGSITCAGVGLTLTASSHGVFAELDWVPGNVSQCEDRMHRIGQRESVLIQHLVLEGSLDARMAEVIVDKQEVIDRALDRKTGVTIADAEVAKDEVALVASTAAVPGRGSAAEVQDSATGNMTRERVAEDAAAIPAELVPQIHAGLRVLAGMCDGAMKLDDCGFNKMDAEFGHSLAGRAYLTPRMAAAGARLCIKYRRQLGAELAEACKAALRKT